MNNYKFEIITPRSIDVTYIYANSCVAACKIFDSKKIDVFKLVHVLLEGVILSSRYSSSKKWSV